MASLSKATVIGIGLFAANECLRERAGQFTLNSMNPRRQACPGKARDAVEPDPDFFYKIDPKGEEEMEAHPPDWDCLWYELVSRTSQMLEVDFQVAA